MLNTIFLTNWWSIWLLLQLLLKLQKFKGSFLNYGTVWLCTIILILTFKIAGLNECDSVTEKVCVLTSNKGGKKKSGI